MTAAALPTRTARAWLKTARGDGWLAWPSRDEAGARVVVECKRAGWADFDESCLAADPPAPSPYRITGLGRDAIAAEPELFEATS